MEAFARLYERLDATTSTRAKVDAMVDYLRAAPPEDAAWAVFFLTGRRFERLVPVRALAGWAMEVARVPGWLFEECYGVVGDLAELIALLVAGLPFEVPPEPPELAGASRDPRAARDLFAALEPPPGSSSAAPASPPRSLAEHARAVLALRNLPEPVQRARVLALWQGRGRTELMLIDKMITGALRVGVSALLVQRALAELSGVPAEVIAHRLMGAWEPSAEAFAALVAPATLQDDPSRPYPFALASPLDTPVEALGSRDDWRAEWKWDGIRCQLVKRGGHLWLWSRGEELVTPRFPEIEAAARALPDGLVLDGEVLGWRDDRPLPFSIVQRRIGRKVLGPRVLAEAPVALVAFDLLEEGGEDVRELSFDARRARLERIVERLGEPRIRLSPLLDAPSWAELAALRERAREHGTEGLMLKHREARYRPGRHRGELWKWKTEPLSVDAVLVHAQPGSGRRSNLFTDYTFAVWDRAAASHDAGRGEHAPERTLVPFAKAYSGLDDAEIAELDRWIRGHTIARHGPVRVVEPVHVFEIAFEGIARSRRHRSGVAVRFPRIARWRRDKPIEEADSLEGLGALLRLVHDAR